MTGRTVRVSAFDEVGYTLHLEPEGMSYEVVPGASITLLFVPSNDSVEVTWTSAGLVVGRPTDTGELPTVLAEDGSTLAW